MRKKFLCIVPVFALFMVYATCVSAGITYVDATDASDPSVAANTALATGEVFTADDPGTSGSGADGLWRKRAFSNGGTIFEAAGDWGGNNSEDCPRLMTTVEVPRGKYKVYAYMITASDAQWLMGASLEDSEGDLPLYLCNDPNGAATLAVAEDFAEPVPMLTQDNRTLWQIPLGTTGVTTAITVYIDDYADRDPANGGNLRTWYDGIGYEAVPIGITYVDATDASDPNVAANTALATGEVFTADDPGTAGSGADGLWRKRVYANEGSIFESGGSWEADLNTEDCPRLVTSVDVPEGNYDVYVYMWCDDTGAQWRIQASLENLEGDLPLYLANDPNGEATLALAEDFEEPVPMLAEGNRFLWQVKLGTTGLTTTIDVYIDDDPNHITGNARTWYDGIGYEPAIPNITYVDATDASDPNVAANTTLATGEVFTADDPGTAGSGADGLWRKRAYANSGTIFEAGGSWEGNGNTEDCPRLMTSVDVPEDKYDVYVYLWADGDQWRIQASLENLEGDLPLYLANDPNGEATLALAEDFEEPVPLLVEDNRTLWQVKLGTTGATNVIDVYIDDDPNHLYGAARTWYDGIGYRLYVARPEEPKEPEEPEEPNEPALEPAEPIDPGTEGLVAHYAMEGDATDSSGNGLDGVIMGDPIFVEGHVGLAIDLSGDDQVDCNNPDGKFDITGGLTVATWVNIRSLPQAWAPAVVKGEDAYRISSNSSSTSFHFGINHYTTANYGVNGSTQVGMNEWHHVCGTFDGTTITLYLDGVVDGTLANDVGIGVSTDPFRIGANITYEDRFWDGLIDEVMIFDRALTANGVAFLAIP